MNTDERGLLKPVPHEDAMAFIRGKPAIAQDSFRRLLPALKGRAFTISGIESANVLQSVRDKIAELPAGADWDTLKAQIADDISPYLVDENADPETKDAQIAAANRRAELLLRVHGFQAYQAAQYDVMMRQTDVMPYWQYMSMEDEAVRPEHAALDGLILPADSPFWSDHYPPWDWGCRCQVVPITADEYASAEQGDGWGRVLSDKMQSELEQNGRLAVSSGQVLNVSSPTAKGKEGAFAWHPGDLRIPVEQLKGRYDPQVWKSFEDWARAQSIGDGKTTIWGWLNGDPLLPATAPTTAPAAPAAQTFGSVIKSLGLDKKADWDEADIDKLWRELKEDFPAKAGDKIASVNGAKAKGVFSEKNIRAMVQNVLDVVPADVADRLPPLNIWMQTASKDVLGSYGGGNLRLFTNKIKKYSIGSQEATMRETVYHELMHWVHDNAPQSYKDSIADLYASRTAADVPSPDGSGGWIRKDRWWWEYAGRQYSWETKAQGLEVATTHFQLFSNPARMSEKIKETNGETIKENLEKIMEVFFAKP